MKAQGVTLNIIVTDQQAPGVEAVVDDFVAATEGVDAVEVVASGTRADDQLTYLTTLLAAGDSEFDVIGLDTVWTAQFAENGWIKDLTGDLEAGEMDDYFDEDEVYEFIDKDRFKVNEMYWEFIESEDAEHIEKSISILKNIIKKDPDYFDPYITLHEYYLENAEPDKAIVVLVEGYDRAMDLIMLDGEFPDELLWGFLENRHIVRMIFNYALLMWRLEDTERAVSLMLQLLRSNPGDNIGARYYIVAILEGFESEEAFEAGFMEDGEEYIDWQKQEEWFQEKIVKHKRVLGWWLDMEEDE